MGAQRAHLVLPPDLIAEIDAFAGPRGRSAFVAEVARAELKKRRLLCFLRDEEPAWEDGDHPELADGSEEWVTRLRSASDARPALLHFEE